MERRALLASAGTSIAALSGCFSSREGRGDPSTEETPVDETTTPTTAAPDVTVESAVQQHGFVMTETDYIRVENVGIHYLVADVRVESGALERAAFTLTVGSAEIEPTHIDRFYRTEWGDGQWYEQGRERGLLAFELPDDLGSGAPRLRWPSGDWVPDEAFVQRLTTRGSRLDAAISVPDASDGTTDKTVEITVTNEGENETRYLGALSRGGPAVASTPITRISTLVDVGETATIEIADRWGMYPSEEERDDGVRDVTYRLDAADGGDRLEIDVSE